MSYRCNEYTFAVDAPPSVSQPLHVLLRAFASEVEPDHRWEISLDDETATLKIDGRTVFDNVPERLIQSYVNTTLTRQVLDNEPQLLHLHAMAVLDGEKAIVVAGQSGSGKSTLCAALVVAGATYLTDETIALDAGAFGLRTYPKPISVKKFSSGYMRQVTEIHLIEEHGPGPWELDPSVLGRVGHGRGHAVGTLATFAISEVADARFEPTHRATVVRKLLADGHDVERFGGEALRVTAQLAAAAHCVEVFGRDAEALAPELLAIHRREVIDGQIQEVPPPVGPGPARREGVASLILDGRALLFDQCSSRVIELDESRTVHWLACDGSSFESAVRDVSDVFEIRQDEAFNAVTTARSEFEELGLL